MRDERRTNERFPFVVQRQRERERLSAWVLLLLCMKKEDPKSKMTIKLPDILEGLVSIVLCFSYFGIKLIIDKNGILLRPIHRNNFVFVVYSWITWADLHLLSQMFVLYNQVVHLSCFI
jgi:hypothetical protein